MKKGKFILSAAALVVTFVSAFAFKTSTKKLGAGTLYSKTGHPAASLVDCKIGGPVDACFHYTGTLYTFFGTQVTRSNGVQNTDL